MLRHGICVPKACPNVSKTYDRDSRLYTDLKNCYNKKFSYLGLTGIVTKISCDTNNPKYPIDWWDITIA